MLEISSSINETKSIGPKLDVRLHPHQWNNYKFKSWLIFLTLCAGSLVVFMCRCIRVPLGRRSIKSTHTVIFALLYKPWYCPAQMFVDNIFLCCADVPWNSINLSQNNLAIGSRRDNVWTWKTIWNSFQRSWPTFSELNLFKTIVNE